MRILVKLPTRSRPRKATEAIAHCRQLASGVHQVEYRLSIDEDDPASLERAQEWRAMGLDVRVGRSESKVHACNRDLPPAGGGPGWGAGGYGFDVLVLLSDDMACKEQGWDAVIAAEMQRRFPGLDGALHFNDGHVGQRLCTMPIMGVNLYGKFGYVYNPEYSSVWCDNEQTELLQALGRLPYIDRVLFEHRHPSYGQAARDPLLDHTESFYARDEAVYRRRKARVREESLVAFDFPDILLSICIPTLARRGALLGRLLASLYPQINAHPERLRIETWIDRDEGEATVGAKRNRLMDRCKGRFVVYIDDDDEISQDYIARIIAAIQRDPETDCVAIEGQITTDGGNPRPFLVIKECGRYHEDGAWYKRTPNHIAPVRRDHALATRFPERNYGEDTDYATRLFASGRLKCEQHAGHAPIYFYRYSPAGSATRGR